MATDGRPFGVTLAKACKDATVKQCNFTTPLALHAKRPHPNPPLIRFKGDKGKGRGRGLGGKLLAKTTNTAPIATSRSHATRALPLRRWQMQVGYGYVHQGSHSCSGSYLQRVVEYVDISAMLRWTSPKVNYKATLLVADPCKGVRCYPAIGALLYLL